MLPDLLAIEPLVERFALPFFRIAAMLMAAPMFGARLMPPQIRIVYAVALGMALAPLMSISDASSANPALSLLSLIHI